MSTWGITLGSQSYPAGREEFRRQCAALDSWRALDGVALVDLQFEDTPSELPGFRCVPKLRHDSRQMAGVDGRRKPIVSEMFDLLAREAVAAGHGIFVFSNTDILLQPETLDAIRTAAAAGSKAQVFARADFDGPAHAGPARPPTIFYEGQDVFALDARWWLDNRRRFRPYVIGEGGWDNIYTAVLMRHAPGAILHHRTPLAWHERHPILWAGSPFIAYAQCLIALDHGPYSDWTAYYDRLRVLRPDGNPGDEAREAAAWREAFASPLTWGKRVRQIARVGRALARQWRENVAREEARQAASGRRA